MDKMVRRGELPCVRQSRPLYRFRGAVSMSMERSKSEKEAKVKEYGEKRTFVA
jgi:hypothetical protein